MTDATKPTAFVERGLALFQELLQEDARLRREFALSEMGFFGGRGRPNDPHASLRHLEWFLSECYSEPRNGVTVEKLLDAFRERADGSFASFAESLRESIAGVFQVTGVQQDRGVWVQDVTAGGEYPLVEPEAAGEFAEGDLVIGRIYPLGDGSFCVSPSAALFRNPDLLEALHSDIAIARETRRGAPRLSQAVLEAVFFVAPRPSVRPSNLRHDAIEKAMSWMRENSLDEDQCEAVLRELSAIPFDAAAPVLGKKDALGRILSELQLHCTMDLAEARRVLHSAWSALWIAASTSVDPPARTDVSRALAEFDRARAAGGDIDLLFDKLEGDLGIADAYVDEDADLAPDFPGVVGAVVDEFLWEQERTQPDRRTEYQLLQKLVVFSQPIGVFEELGVPQLLEFVTCWILEPGVLDGPHEGQLLLGVLGDFCRWADEHQGLDLMSSFSQPLDALQESFPRLLEANQLLTPASCATNTTVFEITEIAPGRLWARARGLTRAFDVSGEMATRLRAGDLMRVAIPAHGAPQLIRFYPAQAADVLRQADCATPSSDPNPDR